MIEVSLEEARQFILDMQGLRTTKPCKSIMGVARRIHNIQIDTISVVTRSHNLTTFNRFQDYQEDKIWDELKKGHLFEYWSHSICLMPIETFPYYRWVANYFAQKTKGWPVEWGVRNPAIVEEVYQHVKMNGSTASRDMGTQGGKREGWWDWKVEKHALEYLFTTGRLMVAFREGFQKYYDLTDRVLPSSIPSESLSNEDAARFAALTTIGSLGLANWQDVKFYTGSMVYRDLWGSTKGTKQFLDSMVQNDEIVQVSINDVKEAYYVLSEKSTELQNHQSLKDETSVKFLCPFDNLIRERHLPKNLWSFDYTIEAYTPPNQRKYGYYVLPILYESDFIGRMDAKVHRNKGTLEIKALFLESDEWKKEETLDAFYMGLDSFAHFHNCKHLSFNSVTPQKMKKRIIGLFN